MSDDGGMGIEGYPVFNNGDDNTPTKWIIFALFALGLIYYAIHH